MWVMVVMVEEFMATGIFTNGSTSVSTFSDVSGLAWAQSPGLGLALVGLGFQNHEPGPN